MEGRAEFLRYYEQELTGRYSWAHDAERLSRFMESVRATLDGENTWNKDGDAVNAAWARIGGKGKPTYKALRALA